MAWPTDIPNLALWFRAADLAGLADGTAVGDTGTQWASLVGSSVASQATAGFRPTKQTDTNGAACVRFDGTDDRLSLSGDALTFSANVGGITMAARARANQTGVQVVLLSGQASNLAAVRYLLRQLSTGTFGIGGRRLDADAFQALSGGALGTTQPRVQVGVLDYAGATAAAYLDGVLTSSTAAFQTAGVTSNTSSAN